MEAYTNFHGEVPSPSGSDDSGIGLSPNPPLADLRNCGGGAFPLETPPESQFVAKSYNSVEYTEGRAFNCCAYNQAPSVDGGSYLRDAFDSKPTKQNFQEIDNLLELINKNNNSVSVNNNSSFDVGASNAKIVETLLPTANGKNRKKSTQSQKHLRGVDLNSKQILKLERCMQPKTGNGKPRQTSTKRKMNHGRRIDSNRPVVYPGVRPKTVREVLDQMRKKHGGHQKPQQQQQQAQQFGSATPGPSYQARQSAPQPPQYVQMEQYKPIASAPLRHSTGFSTPASGYSPTPTPAGLAMGPYQHQISEGFLNDMPHAMTFESNPSCSIQQLATVPDPHFAQSLSPSSSTISCGSPYQGNPFPAYSPQPDYQDFVDMQSFVTSQNFATSTDSFQTTFPCMDSAPNFGTMVTNMGQQSFVPETSAPVDYVSIHSVVMHETADKLTAYLSVSPGYLDHKDESGMTPLLLAVKVGKSKMVDVLLCWGADPHVIDAQGCNILHIAAEHATADMMLFLATKIPQQQFLDLCNRTAALKAGRTPLHVAVENRRIENVMTLLRHGASLTAEEHRCGWSALHIAVKNGDAEATKQILSFAAASDIGVKQQHQQRDSDMLQKVVGQRAYNENTALHFAAELQTSNDPSLIEAQAHIINLLLDNDANPLVKNHQSQNPIQLLSTTNPQICERMRAAGRRFTHTGASTLDMTHSPPLHHSQQQAALHFPGLPAASSRSHYME